MTSKPKAQPVDPTACAPSLHEVASEVKDLAARVDELEQQGAPAPPVPAQPQTAGGNQPAAGPRQLQDVLPDIKDLSDKVGGLEHLSEIVDTLKQAHE